MKTIIITNNITLGLINYIAKYLNSGKVIVYPSDTIYGLGCLATDKKAIEKIYRIKGKDKKKGLISLVSSLAMVKKYCFVSGRQEKELRRLWNLIPLPPFRKGENISIPTTVILKSRGVLPVELEGGTGSLAVRLPKNDFLIKIIRAVGVPLVSTSANLSEQPVITNPIGLEKYFKKYKPNLVVDAGEIKGRASRLVDIRDEENIIILRK